MCIRDSLHGHQPFLNPADAEPLDLLDLSADLPPGGADLAVSLGGDGTVLRTAQAVSYTHLRAPETVLDLVCRLLLEKKKHISHRT